MNDDPQINLSHEAVSQALQTLFVEEDLDKAFQEVPAWQVHQHLADCETCRRQYDGIALADRLLATDVEEPLQAPRGEFETNFAEASFMGALDQMLEEEAQDTGDADVVDLSAQRSRRMQVLGQIGLAAAVLLVAGTSWYAFNHLQTNNAHNTTAPDNQDFQARSAAPVDSTGPFAEPAVEIFCAERTPDGVQFTGTKDAPFGLLTCPRDAELKLAYENPSAKLRYAAFVGVGQNGRIYYYGPTPADVDAVEARTSGELEPFGESIQLEVNHEPGPVRVIGLFATEPIDFLSLDKLVSTVGREKLFDGETVELPFRGVMTSSTFEVSDGGQR